MPSPEYHPYRNCRWSHEETSMLIKLWLRDDIHQRFNGTSRNSLVCSKITDNLKANGFQKTDQQVRLKIKNLEREYKLALRKRRTSGGKAKLTFRYFSELDKFLRRSPPTVLTPTVIYMDQEKASAKSTDEEGMERCSPGGNTERLPFESHHDDNLVPFKDEASVLRSSNEENMNYHLTALVTTKCDDTANSDHALYTAKADDRNEDEDADLSSLAIKKAKENKTKLNTMEEILSRVLDTALDKFMKFERQIEEKNKVETNSFRNEVLALEWKKLEESVTQTLQNDRLICLMVSLISNYQ